jgi:hypothetical protein
LENSTLSGNILADTIIGILLIIGSAFPISDIRSRTRYNVERLLDVLWPMFQINKFITLRDASE